MRYTKGLLPLLAGFAALVLVACGQPQTETAPPPAPASVAPTEPEPMVDDNRLVAEAVLQSRSDANVSGTVTFTQDGDNVAVVAQISGVAAAGTYGFHLHEIGDCSAPDFTSAGSHFNPTGTPHGAPDAADHHAGDFGNIEIGSDGTGKLDLSTKMLTVSEGPNTVIGRAVILHDKADDLQTQPTGDAGGRVACGVVELSGGDDGMTIAP